VPIIDKRKAQILSVHERMAQLMDLETYDTFELEVPEELRTSLQPGGETMYLETLGRKKLSTP
jgi:translation initiation factor 5A